MDTLIWLHRRLQRTVDRLHLRPLAQRCFRALLARRYGETGGLATVVQNDREWQLDPEVALRGNFAEFETIEWLRKVVQPGMCVFDVGANVGQMTLEMAYLVGPTGRVVAIEPAGGNLAVLRRHVAGNGFADRVEIIAAACADRAGGTVEMTIFGADAEAVGSGHTLARGTEPLHELARQQPHVTVQVPTVSMDALRAGHGLDPDVIKIDVEGAELDVLRGARNTLRECRPKVRVGFHPFAFPDPTSASNELRRLLDECGYTLLPAEAPPTLELAEYVAAPRPQS